jgi:DNA-binding IclR family transcriptional regulator
MGTVSKALELLDLFSRARPRLGLTEAARMSGLNKATCYRLMTELGDFGLVEQVGPAREYRLGPAILRLAALREAHVPTREAALPLLQGLANRLGETTHASLLIGGELRAIAYAYSATHAMTVMMEDADVLPFHATSSGLAVLAFLPPQAREEILSRPLARLTARTETDVAALRDRIARVRAEGIAESKGGFEAEVDSLAVPLFDAFGQVCGALAVAVPAARMTDDLRGRIAAALGEAGPELTALWGGRPQDAAEARRAG